MGKGIEVKIDRDLIIHAVKEFSNFDDVEVDLLGDTFRVVFKTKALVFKIPVTITFRLVELQKEPDDPIVFEIIANPFVKSLIKEFDGRSIKVDSNYFRVYPSKMFSFLRKFVVDEISFEESSIRLRLKLFEKE